MINSPFFVDRSQKEGPINIPEDGLECLVSLKNAVKRGGRVHVIEIAGTGRVATVNDQLTIVPFERAGFRLEKKETVQFSVVNYHMVFVKP